MVSGTVSHKMWDEKGINGCQKTRIYWKKKSRGERLLMKIRRKMNTKKSVLCVGDRRARHDR